MRTVRLGVCSVSQVTLIAAAILAVRASAQVHIQHIGSALLQSDEEAAANTPTPLLFDQEPKSINAPILPDSPGWTLPSPPRPLPPCSVPGTVHPAQARPGLFSASQPSALPTTSLQAPPVASQPCIQVNPYHRFLDNTNPIPLSPRQKGYLALHNLKDPGNLITIVGTAAFTIGTNAHTAYGPGMRGFGLNTGYSLSQDATGEFFGTFLIPSLLHEDPHYHRLPQAAISHRVLHAISRTVIAQHDDGRIMPNYAVLLTYPISAEISNLYVPGVNVNAASTAKRVATGLATDPVGNIITEFLPDIAKRINIRVIFVQRILNAVTAGSNAGNVVSGP